MDRLPNIVGHDRFGKMGVQAMIIIKCDFCGVVVSTPCHPKATIMRGAMVREYELCSSCAGKLIEDLEKKVKV